ncbi:MAG: hypothetical protein LBD57_04795 [Endomicrobium sp.]|uniref:tetratricopeptide repeat protein n=1 Tax=Candidatus Endomicrobiellum cubanum TaxID=3242325 RepID=UPI002832AAB1|nr:hypothetical protein [Endomicrobium sp.]
MNKLLKCPFKNFNPAVPKNVRIRIFKKTLISFLCLFIFLDLVFSFERIVTISKEEVQVDSAIKHCKSQKEKIKELEAFALNAYNNNQYDLSLCAYNKLLSFKKNSKKKEFSYYMSLGDIYCLKNNYVFAMHMYQKALSMYKKNEEINIKIANLYLKINIYKSAKIFFNNVLKSNKKSVDAKKGLANLYYLKNNYQKAIFYYEQIDFFHIDKNTILKIADSYTNLNEINKAIKILEDYTKNNKSFEVLFFLGQLYIENTENLKAKELFLNLYENHKDNFKVCLYLANVYNLLGERSLSNHMLGLAYKINSSCCALNILRAEFSYKLGHVNEAKEYAQRALMKAKTVFLRNQAQKLLTFLQKGSLKDPNAYNYSEYFDRERQNAGLAQVL